MSESQATKNKNQSDLNDSQAVDNAISHHQIEALQKKVDELERSVKALTEERNSYLKGGIIVLGSIVMGLLIWIFKSITEHPK